MDIQFVNRQNEYSRHFKVLTLQYLPIFCWKAYEK